MGRKGSRVTGPEFRKPQWDRRRVRWPQGGLEPMMQVMDATIEGSANLQVSQERRSARWRSPLLLVFENLNWAPPKSQFLVIKTLRYPIVVPFNEYKFGRGAAFASVPK
jgi:hypothetical protein